MNAAGVLLLGVVAAAAGPDLRWEAFEVHDAAPTSLVGADLGSHPQARRYKALIREGQKQGINFAGRYTAIRIPCHSRKDAIRAGFDACTTLALVDRKTGKVDFPPEFQALQWERKSPSGGFSFRRDSRLVQFQGEDELKSGFSARFYEWRNGTVRLVAEAVP